MFIGKNYVYVTRNKDNKIRMFTDEKCTQPYINSAIYKDVCREMHNIKVNQVELYCI